MILKDIPSFHFPPQHDFCCKIRSNMNWVWKMIIKWGIMNYEIFLYSQKHIWVWTINCESTWLGLMNGREFLQTSSVHKTWQLYKETQNVFCVSQVPCVYSTWKMQKTFASNSSTLEFLVIHIPFQYLPAHSYLPQTLQGRATSKAHVTVCKNRSINSYHYSFLPQTIPNWKQFRF